MQNTSTAVLEIDENASTMASQIIECLLNDSSFEAVDQAR